MVLEPPVIADLVYVLFDGWFSVKEHQLFFARDHRWNFSCFHFCLSSYFLVVSCKREIFNFGSCQSKRCSEKHKKKHWWWSEWVSYHVFSLSVFLGRASKFIQSSQLKWDGSINCLSYKFEFPITVNVLSQVKILQHQVSCTIQSSGNCGFWNCLV